MARTNIPKFLVMIRDMTLYLHRNQATMIRNGELSADQQQALQDLARALTRAQSLLISYAPSPKAPVRRKVDLWPVDTRAIYDAQGGRCHYCQAKLFPYGAWSKSVKVPGARRYAIDHAQPVSLGGSDAPENLRIACVECNQQKGMLTEEEFFAVLATRK